MTLGSLRTILLVSRPIINIGRRRCSALLHVQLVLKWWQLHSPIHQPHSHLPVNQPKPLECYITTD